MIRPGDEVTSAEVTKRFLTLVQTINDLREYNFGQINAGNFYDGSYLTTPLDTSSEQYVGSVFPKSGITADDNAWLLRRFYKDIEDIKKRS